MKLLLHSCCGPCSIIPLRELKAEGHEIRGFFYNPNIHPYTEFQKRLDTFARYAAQNEVPVILDEQYHLEEYLRQIAFREGERCRICYGMRLQRAAQIAKKGGFEAFTTTLLVSPYQKHQLIADIGAAIGEETGVPFLYRDYRLLYKEGVRISREEEMYRQSYCGCIYSEKERYQAKKKKILENQGGDPHKYDDDSRIY